MLARHYPHPRYTPAPEVDRPTGRNDESVTLLKRRETNEAPGNFKASSEPRCNVQRRGVPYKGGSAMQLSPDTHQLSDRRFLPRHLQSISRLARNFSNFAVSLKVSDCELEGIVSQRVALRTSHHFLIAGSAPKSLTEGPLIRSLRGFVVDLPLAMLANESLLRLMFFRSKFDLSVPEPSISVSYTGRFDMSGLRLGPTCR